MMIVTTMVNVVANTMVIVTSSSCESDRCNINCYTSQSSTIKNIC